MDSENKQEYQALCRGAATYILLGNNMDLGMTAEEIASVYAIDPATVREDIDAIVQTERHKSGGVFESSREERSGREQSR